MKKISLILLFCLIACPIYAWAWPSGFIQKITIGSLPGYNDILFYWDCETDNTVYSAAGTLTASYTNASVTTAFPIVGAKSLALTANNVSQAAFTITTDNIVNHSTGQIGFYWYDTAAPASNDVMFQVKYDLNNRIYAVVSGTELILYYIGNSTTKTASTSGANLQMTTTYFINCKWDINAGLPGGDTLEIWINGSKSASTTSALTAMASSPNLLTIGNNSSVSYVGYMDQIYVSNSLARDLYACRNSTTCHP